ncbi:MAG TPA: methyltransferase domain-containing protein [Candidatus Binatia bacterium]|nr:methyltransferase domain-containing protein [Candidatus Binatia bacterium]
MDESAKHLAAIRDQFTRQADVYARMRQTTDPAGLDALVMLSGAEPEHRVLDVACGPGFLTMAFAARCREAVGADATDRFLALARSEAASRGLANVRFEPADAERLPFDDGSFDVVACRAAFHHFVRPERVLGEMKRVAKGDGRLLVADLLGSEDPTRAAYHDRIERLCDPTHVCALPRSAFDALFRDTGLDVALRPTTVVHYDLEEWMAHGGPSPEVAREIVALMEDSLPDDRSGLKVRRENGRLAFSHNAAAFVLRPAGPAAPRS